MIAKWRVFMGFVAGGVYLFLAHVASGPRAGTGLAIALAGLLLRGWAAGHLDKGRRLAQSGPYAWFRHPLYMGSFLLALGFCVAGTGAYPVHGAVLWAVFVFLFAWIYPRRIREEENSLEERFGDDWRLFAAETHRFLPRASPRRIERPDPFLWSLYRKNREINAALGFAAGVVVLTLKGVFGW